MSSSLVDYDEEKKKYFLHNLLADFADARLSRDEYIVSHLRHAQHYLLVAMYADRLYIRGDESMLAGLRLFDAEFANIMAGQAWVETRAETIKEAARLAKLYPGVSVFIIDLRLTPAERIRWLSSGIYIAQKSGDSITEGYYLDDLGRAYHALSDQREALQCYEKALRISKKTKDLDLQGMILSNMGNAYLKLGDFQSAIQCHGKALRLRRQIGDLRGEGNDLGNLGSTYLAMGKFRKAIKYCQDAVAIRQRIGDIRSEGNDLNNIGSAHLSLGELEEAANYLDRALNIARAVGDKLGENHRLGNLGIIHMLQERYDKSMENYLQSLSIAREIGDKEGEATALSNLSSVDYALHQIREALRFAQGALEIYVQIESPKSEMARQLVEKLKRQLEKSISE